MFIHPSREAADGDCEGGAPIVLLDAQATGLPAISTRHCDIPEEVLDGESGLLVSEGDTEALAHCIRTFYGMGQQEYDAFAHAGRAHVETCFDIRVNATSLRSIYEELLVRREKANG